MSESKLGKGKKKFLPKLKKKKHGVDHSLTSESFLENTEDISGFSERGASTPSLESEKKVKKKKRIRIGSVDVALPTTKLFKKRSSSESSISKDKDWSPISRGSLFSSFISKTKGKKKSLSFSADRNLDSDSKSSLTSTSVKDVDEQYSFQETSELSDEYGSCVSDISSPGYKERLVKPMEAQTDLRSGEQISMEMTEEQFLSCSESEETKGVIEEDSITTVLVEYHKGAELSCNPLNLQMSDPSLLCNEQRRKMDMQTANISMEDKDNVFNVASESKKEAEVGDILLKGSLNQSLEAVVPSTPTKICHDQNDEEFYAQIQNVETSVERSLSVKYLEDIDDFDNLDKIQWRLDNRTQSYNFSKLDEQLTTKDAESVEKSCVFEDELFGQTSESFNPLHECKRQNTSQPTRDSEDQLNKVRLCLSDKEHLSEDKQETTTADSEKITQLNLNAQNRETESDSNKADLGQKRARIVDKERVEKRESEDVQAKRSRPESDTLSECKESFQAANHVVYTDIISSKLVCEKAVPFETKPAFQSIEDDHFIKDIELEIKDCREKLIYVARALKRENQVVVEEDSHGEEEVCVAYSNYSSDSSNKKDVQHLQAQVESRTNVFPLHYARTTVRSMPCYQGHENEAFQTYQASDNVQSEVESEVDISVEGKDTRDLKPLADNLSYSTETCAQLSEFVLQEQRTTSILEMSSSHDESRCGEQSNKSTANDGCTDDYSDNEIHQQECDSPEGPNFDTVQETISTALPAFQTVIKEKELEERETSIPATQEMFSQSQSLKEQQTFEEKVSMAVDTITKASKNDELVLANNAEHDQMHKVMTLSSVVDHESKSFQGIQACDSVQSEVESEVDISVEGKDTRDLKPLADNLSYSTETCVQLSEFVLQEQRTTSILEMSSSHDESRCGEQSNKSTANDGCTDDYSDNEIHQQECDSPEIRNFDTVQETISTALQASQTVIKEKELEERETSIPATQEMFSQSQSLKEQQTFEEKVSMAVDTITKASKNDELVLANNAEHDQMHKVMTLSSVVDHESKSFQGIQACDSVQSEVESEVDISVEGKDTRDLKPLADNLSYSTETCVLLSEFVLQEQRTTSILEMSSSHDESRCGEQSNKSTANDECTDDYSDNEIHQQKCDSPERRNFDTVQETISTALPASQTVIKEKELEERETSIPATQEMVSQSQNLKKQQTFEEKVSMAVDTITKASKNDELVLANNADSNEMHQVMCSDVFYNCNLMSQSNIGENFTVGKEQEDVVDHIHTMSLNLFLTIKPEANAMIAPTKESRPVSQGVEIEQRQSPLKPRDEECAVDFQLYATAEDRPNGYEDKRQSTLCLESSYYPPRLYRTNLKERKVDDDSDEKKSGTLQSGLNVDNTIIEEDGERERSNSCVSLDILQDNKPQYVASMQDEHNQYTSPSNETGRCHNNICETKEISHNIQSVMIHGVEESVTEKLSDIVLEENNLISTVTCPVDTKDCEEHIFSKPLEPENSATASGKAAIFACDTSKLTHLSSSKKTGIFDAKDSEVTLSSSQSPRYGIASFSDKTEQILAMQNMLEEVLNTTELQGNVLDRGKKGAVLLCDQAGSLRLEQNDSECFSFKDEVEPTIRSVEDKDKNKAITLVSQAENIKEYNEGSNIQVGCTVLQGDKHLIIRDEEADVTCKALCVVPKYAQGEKESLKSSPRDELNVCRKLECKHADSGQCMSKEAINEDLWEAESKLETHDNMGPKLHTYTEFSGEQSIVSMESTFTSSQYRGQVAEGPLKNVNNNNLLLGSKQEVLLPAPLDVSQVVSQSYESEVETQQPLQASDQTGKESENDIYICPVLEQKTEALVQREHFLQSSIEDCRVQNLENENNGTNNVDSNEKPSAQHMISCPGNLTFSADFCLNAKREDVCHVKNSCQIGDTDSTGYLAQESEEIASSISKGILIVSSSPQDSTNPETITLNISKQNQLLLGVTALHTEAEGTKDPSVRGKTVIREEERKYLFSSNQGEEGFQEIVRSFSYEQLLHAEKFHDNYGSDKRVQYLPMPEDTKGKGIKHVKTDGSFLFLNKANKEFFCGESLGTQALMLDNEGSNTNNGSNYPLAAGTGSCKRRIAASDIAYKGTSMNTKVLQTGQQHLKDEMLCFTCPNERDEEATIMRKTKYEEMKCLSSSETQKPSILYEIKGECKTGTLGDSIGTQSKLCENNYLLVESNMSRHGYPMAKYEGEKSSKKGLSSEFLPSVLDSNEEKSMEDSKAGNGRVFNNLATRSVLDSTFPSTNQTQSATSPADSEFNCLSNGQKIVKAAMRENEVSFYGKSLCSNMEKSNSKEREFILTGRRYDMDTDFHSAGEHRTDNLSRSTCDDEIDTQYLVVSANEDQVLGMDVVSLTVTEYIDNDNAYSGPGSDSIHSDSMPQEYISYKYHELETDCNKVPKLMSESLNDGGDSMEKKARDIEIETQVTNEESVTALTQANREVIHQRSRDDYESSCTESAEHASGTQNYLLVSTGLNDDITSETISVEILEYHLNSGENANIQEEDQYQDSNEFQQCKVNTTLEAEKSFGDNVSLQSEQREDADQPEYISDLQDSSYSASNNSLNRDNQSSTEDCNLLDAKDGIVGQVTDREHASRKAVAELQDKCRFSTCSSLAYPSVVDNHSGAARSDFTGSSCEYGTHREGEEEEAKTLYEVSPKGSAISRNSSTNCLVLSSKLNEELDPDCLEIEVSEYNIGFERPDENAEGALPMAKDQLLKSHGSRMLKREIDNSKSLATNNEPLDDKDANESSLQSSFIKEEASGHRLEEETWENQQKTLNLVWSTGGNPCSEDHSFAGGSIHKNNVQEKNLNSNTNVEALSDILPQDRDQVFLLLNSQVNEDLDNHLMEVEILEYNPVLDQDTCEKDSEDGEIGEKDFSDSFSNRSTPSFTTEKAKEKSYYDEETNSDDESLSLEKNNAPYECETQDLDQHEEKISDTETKLMQEIVNESQQDRIVNADASSKTYTDCTSSLKNNDLETGTERTTIFDEKNISGIQYQELNNVNEEIVHENSVETATLQNPNVKIMKTDKEEIRKKEDDQALVSVSSSFNVYGSTEFSGVESTMVDSAKGIDLRMVTKECVPQCTKSLVQPMKEEKNLQDNVRNAYLSSQSLLSLDDVNFSRPLASKVEETSLNEKMLSDNEYTEADLEYRQRIINAHLKNFPSTEKETLGCQERVGDGNNFESVTLKSCKDSDLALDEQENARAHYVTAKSDVTNPINLLQKSNENPESDTLRNVTRCEDDSYSSKPSVEVNEKESNQSAESNWNPRAEDAMLSLQDSWNSSVMQNRLGYDFQREYNTMGECAYVTDPKLLSFDPGDMEQPVQIADKTELRTEDIVFTRAVMPEMKASHEEFDKENLHEKNTQGACFQERLSNVTAKEEFSTETTYITNQNEASDSNVVKQEDVTSLTYKEKDVIVKPNPPSDETHLDTLREALFDPEEEKSVPALHKASKHKHVPSKAFLMLSLSEQQDKDYFDEGREKYFPQEHGMEVLHNSTKDAGSSVCQTSAPVANVQEFKTPTASEGGADTTEYKGVQPIPSADSDASIQLEILNLAGPAFSEKSTDLKTKAQAEGFPKMEMSAIALSVNREIITEEDKADTHLSLAHEGKESIASSSKDDNLPKPSHPFSKVSEDHASSITEKENKQESHSSTETKKTYMPTPNANHVFETEENKSEEDPLQCIFKSSTEVECLNIPEAAGKLVSESQEIHSTNFDEEDKTVKYRKAFLTAENSVSTPTGEREEGYREKNRLREANDSAVSLEIQSTVVEEINEDFPLHHQDYLLMDHGKHDIVYQHHVSAEEEQNIMQNLPQNGGTNICVENERTLNADFVEECAKPYEKMHHPCDSEKDWHSSCINKNINSHTKVMAVDETPDRNSVGNERIQASDFLLTEFRFAVSTKDSKEVERPLLVEGEDGTETLSYDTRASKSFLSAPSFPMTTPRSKEDIHPTSKAGKHPHGNSSRSRCQKITAGTSSFDFNNKNDQDFVNGINNSMYSVSVVESREYAIIVMKEESPAIKQEETVTVDICEKSPIIVRGHSPQREITRAIRKAQGNSHFSVHFKSPDLSPLQESQVSTPTQERAETSYLDQVDKSEVISKKAMTTEGEYSRTTQIIYEENHCTDGVNTDGHISLSNSAKTDPSIEKFRASENGGLQPQSVIPACKLATHPEDGVALPAAGKSDFITDDFQEGMELTVKFKMISESGTDQPDVLCKTQEHSQVWKCEMPSHPEDLEDWVLVNCSDNEVKEFIEVINSNSVL